MNIIHLIKGFRKVIKCNILWQAGRIRSHLFFCFYGRYKNQDDRIQINDEKHCCCSRLQTFCNNVHNFSIFHWISTSRFRSSVVVITVMTIIMANIVTDMAAPYPHLLPPEPNPSR